MSISASSLERTLPARNSGLGRGLGDIDGMCADERIVVEFMRSVDFLSEVQVQRVEVE